MNYVVIDQKSVPLAHKTPQEISELRDWCKAKGIVPKHYLTGDQVILVSGQFQDGERKKRSHARILSECSRKQLQTEYLFDPDYMVGFDPKRDEILYPGKNSECPTPPVYISVDQCGSKYGESEVHYNGNALINDSAYEWNYRYFVEGSNFGHFLTDDHLVKGEKRLVIPHRDNKIRIIDNAVLDQDYNVKVAIEFQCSRIPEQDLRERIHDYMRADIEQIWILGGNASDSNTMKSVCNSEGVPVWSW